MTTQPNNAGGLCQWAIYLSQLSIALWHK